MDKQPKGELNFRPDKTYKHRHKSVLYIGF